MLNRDLAAKEWRPGTHGCVVVAGVVHDPYTGRRLVFAKADAAAVQIDHVVALSDAWQKGAAQWDATRRREFANDPLNLLAVDGPTNAQKSDGDAATWLPPQRSYRCRFVARQVAVKAKWKLSVTQAEHDAIARVLAPVPSGGGVPDVISSQGPGAAGVRPWRCMTPISAPRSGGPPAAAVRTSRISRK